MGIYKDGERLDGGGGGMSPYDYAVQGGFTGTEEEFLAQLNGGPYLPLAGATMRGPISYSVGIYGYNKTGKISADAKSQQISFPNADGTTSGVDLYRAAIRVSGLPLSAMDGMDLNGNRIELLAPPNDKFDAANKGYVDSAIQTAVAGLAGAKIATGSYAGTGKFGATSPTVIDCGFKPKFLLCTALTTLAFSMLDVSSSNRSKFTDTLFWVEGMSIAYIPAQNGSNKGEVPMTITQTDTGISFYVTQGSFQIFGNTQLNANNTTYLWLAIG